MRNGGIKKAGYAEPLEIFSQKRCVIPAVEITPRPRGPLSDEELLKRLGALYPKASAFWFWHFREFSMHRHCAG